MNEEKTPVQRGRKNEAQNWLRAVMDDVYTKVDFPRQCDYDKAVADYRNKTEKISEKCLLTPNNVHSQVRRAIQNLIDSKEMTTIEEKEKVYIPNTPKGKQKYSQTLIRDNVKIRTPYVFIVSDLMFAIAIDENQLLIEGSKVRQYFLDLIGKERCFSIAILTDILLITYHPFNTDEEEAKFFQEMQNFIEYAHNYQIEKQQQEQKAKEKEERRIKSKAFIEQRTKEKKHYPKIP